MGCLHCPSCRQWHSSMSIMLLWAFEAWSSSWPLSLYIKSDSRLMWSPDKFRNCPSELICLWWRGVTVDDMINSCPFSQDWRLAEILDGMPFIFIISLKSDSNYFSICISIVIAFPKDISSPTIGADLIWFRQKNVYTPSNIDIYMTPWYHRAKWNYDSSPFFKLRCLWRQTQYVAQTT